ncbi:MAG: FHA domain-containing protein [Thermodesulfobacteriota bacterium]
MTEQLVLEVIDGPMDGLNCLIDRQSTIGRNVGNILSLALDLEVSGRHVEILREGPSWCLRDLQSTNGTWLKGKKLPPGKTSPVKTGEIFIAGSTIIQLFQGSILDVLSSFSDKGFSDPRKEYTFSPEFTPVWEELYADLPAEGGYCDIRRLFLALVKQVDEREGVDFAAVRTLQSDGRYKVLDPSLAHANLRPMLQTMPQTLIIAPRVWRVLDLAARKDKEGITPLHFCRALLEEGRSLVSRYIRAEYGLLEKFGISLARPAGKGVVAAPSAAESPAGPEAPSPVAPLPDQNGNERPWLDFAMKLERILKGFLDDAESPVAGSGSVHPPALQGSVEEAIRHAPDRAARDAIIAGRLDTLSHLLVLLLAAQREGYATFAARLGARIGKALAAETDEQNKGLLPLGKKTLDPQEITNIIRATLSKVESEGMGEQVIREQIRTKLQKYAQQSQQAG